MIFFTKKHIKLKTPRALLGLGGFSFLEMIAVLVLMALAFSMAASFFFSGNRNLRKSSYELTKVVQSTYQMSTRKAGFYRLVLQEDRQSFLLQEFVPPKPKPKENDKDPDNRKKIEEWEAAQKEFDNMNALQRSELSRLQRGSFKTLKTINLSGSIRVKTIRTARMIDKDTLDPAKAEEVSILFYPSGEVDQTLIVLEDQSDHFFSLEINPLSGRVKSSQTEITEQEWKKSIKGE